MTQPDPTEMSGANLVTACGAVTANGADPYLPELGLAPTELRGLADTAVMLLAYKRELMLVYSRVEASPPVLIVARQLDDEPRIRSLGALLDLSRTLVPAREERLQEYWWRSRVLSALAQGKRPPTPALSSAADSAVLHAHRAYAAGFRTVSRLIDLSDEFEPDAAGSGDLDALAVMIARRNFLIFMRRLVNALDARELTRFVEWATELAGHELSVSAST